MNADTIKETFKHTTQWGASVTTFPMKRHLKCKNPALNVPRRHETVATDTVYSDNTPAVDTGVKMGQLYFGKESLVSDIYPMRSGRQFDNTLEDNIHRCSAMDKLISNSAKNEISHKVKDILRAYNINDWQSDPYHQNQNPAEWWYGTIKAWTNAIMNRTGTPAHCWLLTLQFVCYILNHISTASLGGQVLLQVLYGVTLISASSSCTPSISQFSMLPMISTSLLTVKRGLVSGLGLLNIVVTLSPTWFLILCLSKSSIEVPSGPGLPRIQKGLPRIPIKGLLMLEGRKIISLTKTPLNIQPQRQMGRSQLHQILLLSISNQGMMMVQPQASLCQDSTLMTLLEGPFYYLLEAMGRD